MLKGWNTIGTKIFVMTSEVSLHISKGEYFGTGLSVLILCFRMS